jgi:hypothetical protein
MKLVVSLVLAASVLPAWQATPPATGAYQQPVPQPGAQWKKPEGKPLPPDKPLAHVDGETITVAKLTELLTGAPPLALNSAASNPASS